LGPKDEFDGASRIIKDYYRALIRQMAEEIIRKSDYFMMPSLGRADEIIDNYSCRLSRLSTVYSHLARFATSEGAVPLGENEFRCFGCGGLIQEKDTKCNLCGWTWK